MNDIPRTQNPDQVVKPFHWAAVRGQGRKTPLVPRTGSPCGQGSTLMKEREFPGRTWGGGGGPSGLPGDPAHSIAWVLTEPQVLALCLGFGGMGDGGKHASELQICWRETSMQSFTCCVAHEYL